MPHMIVAMLKGDMAGKKCKHYAVRQKLQVLRECLRLLKELNIPVLMAAHKKIRRSVARGPLNQLDPV
jgi:hypothetical protein